MHALANHPIVHFASLLCCIGIVVYCLETKKILYPTFTVLYTVGITFWFSFGLEIQSWSVTLSSLIQMIFLYRLIYLHLKNLSRVSNLPTKESYEP